MAKPPLMFTVDVPQAPSGCKLKRRVYKTRRAARAWVLAIYPDAEFGESTTTGSVESWQVTAAGVVVGVLLASREPIGDARPGGGIRKADEVRVLVDAAPAKPWARLAVCVGLERPVKGAHWQLLTLAETVDASTLDALDVKGLGVALARCDYPGLVFVTRDGKESRP